ncbi:hypothetical protein BC936DRAFT_142310 [Jimgerdemannia flammicorona]|uniref:Uncharacterized protein n=2 Tax=Jimgerdemannia flammicorona TaxID=994334 RepID=A0A433DMK9_9FUNG|nr:hypothetical protein BC936DRAFT_142310 [Jimgerdemannia flammicorona]
MCSFDGLDTMTFFIGPTCRQPAGIFRFPVYACAYGNGSRESKLLAIGMDQGATCILDTNATASEVLSTSFRPRFSHVFDVKWRVDDVKLLMASSNEASFWNVEKLLYSRSSWHSKLSKF